MFIMSYSRSITRIMYLFIIIVSMTGVYQPYSQNGLVGTLAIDKNDDGSNDDTTCARTRRSKYSPDHDQVITPSL